MALPRSQIAQHMDVAHWLLKPRICWNQIPARCTRHLKFLRQTWGTGRPVEFVEVVFTCHFGRIFYTCPGCWPLWNWMSESSALRVNRLCMWTRPFRLWLFNAAGICVPSFWDVKCYTVNISIYKKIKRLIPSIIRCSCTKPVRLRWTSPNCKFNYHTFSGLIEWIQGVDSGPALHKVRDQVNALSVKHGELVLCGGLSHWKAPKASSARSSTASLWLCEGGRTCWWMLVAG